MESCLDDPEMMQNVDLMIPIGVDLCISHMVSGDWRRIDQIARTVISLIERTDRQVEFFGKPYNPYSYVLGIWGISTALCGDFGQGQRLCEKALSFALEIDHRSSLGVVEYMYGIMLAIKGAGKSARMHLENAIKYLEESQTVIILGVAWAWLGYVHCMMGESKIAVEFAEKGLRMHTDLGIPFWRSTCHWLCSNAYFELGDVEKARQHAELALEFSVNNSERQVEGIAMTWLGRVLAKTAPTHMEAAEDQILQGMSLLDELGMAAETCLSHLRLGEVYAESGRREEALKNLKKAEGMFRDMGMDYWLGKAQEALARLR